MEAMSNTDQEHRITNHATVNSSLQNQAVTIVDVPINHDQKVGYWGPVCYLKHRNLDVRPLAFGDQIRLARVHYFNVSNGVRLFVVMFFLAWFSLNAVLIWKDYHVQQGIVYLEYQKPVRSRPPAITVCTHCLLCGYSNKSSLHADTVLSSDVNWKTLTNKPTSIDLSPNPKPLVDTDFDIKCRLYHNTYQHSGQPNSIDCGQVAPLVRSMQEGHKCFTYFSAIHSSNVGLNLEFDQIPLIRLEVSGKFLFGKSSKRLRRISDSFRKSSWGDLESWNPNRSGSSFWGMYATVHDPDTLPDMFSPQYYRLQPGKVLVIPFQKRITQLSLTDHSCFNYLSQPNRRPEQLHIRFLFSPANGSSSELSPELYRSRGECFLYCMWLQLNTRRCANLFSIFTLEMVHLEQYYRRLRRQGWTESDSAKTYESPVVDFCGSSLQSYQQYLHVRRQCMSRCPPHCTLENFVEQTVYEAGQEGPWNWSTVQIVWSSGAVTYLQHRPKLTLQQVIGNVGGLAHVYLGLSVPYLLTYVMRLLQWGEFLPQHTCFCVFTWCKSCFVTRTTRALQ